MGISRKYPPDDMVAVPDDVVAIVLQVPP